MQPTRMRKSHLRCLLLSIAACVALSLPVAAACVTVPPPDLPQVPAQAPNILDASVYPPAYQILTQLPTEFIVPVQLDEANASFQYDVFVDYDPVANSGSGTLPVIFEGTNLAAADGGINLVSFSLDPGSAVLDPSRCHLIEFLVAYQFDPTSLHTWDSRGGDIVSWFYNPGGGPGGCPIYDAGSLQDGAFPTEASTDALPLVPDSGGDL